MQHQRSLDRDGNMEIEKNAKTIWVTLSRLCAWLSLIMGIIFLFLGFMVEEGGGLRMVDNQYIAFTGTIFIGNSILCWFWAWCINSFAEMKYWIRLNAQANIYARDELNQNLRTLIISINEMKEDKESKSADSNE